MADVQLGKKIGYLSADSLEPIEVKNGTDTVTFGFVADYSKLILTRVQSNGTTTVYEAALTARS